MGWGTKPTKSHYTSPFSLSGSSGKKVSVSIPIGDKANQIQSLPDSYKFDDLKVKSNTNENISPTDKVRVHGMRMGSASDDTIYIETTYFEKI